MKKILLSLGIIAIVAVGAIGATRSFFSDTETSTGNTFTAGAIDLTISSECTYNGGATNVNCAFYEEDGNALFAFNDIKPGDTGESTVKFKLDSNPAWACIAVENLFNEENGCNEPELDAEPNCGDNDNDEGELADELYLNVWIDDGAGAASGGVACNNIPDGNEEFITPSPMSLASLLALAPTGNSFVLPIADSSGDTMRNDPLPAGEHCIGIAWSVDPTAGNESQTDKLGADLKFYVEQYRNNPTFTCAGANLLDQL